MKKQIQAKTETQYSIIENKVFQSKFGFFSYELYLGLNQISTCHKIPKGGPNSQGHDI